VYHWAGGYPRVVIKKEGPYEVRKERREKRERREIRERRERERCVPLGR
jgi:hypothetical protein